MKPSQLNLFGNLTRIDPRLNVTFLGIKAEQGSQILRAPPGSVMKNLVLRGGASHLSPFACLRGAVIKFDANRTAPVKLDGGSFEVPSGHTLMDEGSFRFTAEKRNQGKTVPHQVIHFGKETLYLVHHSFCHPDQLFLPQGAYTQTGFTPLNLEGVSHLQVRGDKIFIFEVQLPVPDASYNLLEQLPIVPQTVVVQLKEGGHVTLRDAFDSVLFADKITQSSP